MSYLLGNDFKLGAINETQVARLLVLAFEFILCDQFKLETLADP